MGRGNQLERPWRLLQVIDQALAMVEGLGESDAARRYLPALETTSTTIDGFVSPLGMELLATVDWLLHEQHVESDVSAIKHVLKTWPGGPARTKEAATLRRPHAPSRPPASARSAI
jgi:hypothetical protein